MSLLDVLKDVYDKVFLAGSINIDNFVAKLHYRVTVTVLVVFSVLLSLQQYAGDPIDCIVTLKETPPSLIDNYCWVEGTWTAKPSHEMTHLGKGGQIDHMDCDPRKEGDCWHHGYYQWVAIVLVCQAGFFHLPRYLWQIWEGGLTEGLVQGLDRKTLVRGLQDDQDLTSGEHNTKLKALVQNWKDSRGTHDYWAWKFYWCELLNFANVFLQFYFTNFFLQGQFQSVALGGIQSQLHVSVLPVTAHCMFQSAGSDGALNDHSFLCVLPLNMINQKFFTLFYFWLGVLVIASGFMLVTRIFIVASADFRDFVLRFVYGIKHFNTNLVKKCSHGDWLLLTLILDNMNLMVNAQFVHRLGQIKEFDEDF